MFSTRIRFITVAALVSAALPASIISGCGSRQAAASDLNTVAIAVQPAVRAGSSATYEGTGSVVARHTYKLAFEVPGRVAAVNAEVGDRVAAGTVIATLDSADYAALARAAHAQADAAAAVDAKAQRGARPQERSEANFAIAAAQGQLDRALAGETLARSNAIRMRSLLADGAISAQQADAAAAAERDSEGAVAAAQAQLAAAQQQSSMVVAGLRGEDRATAAAQLEAARANADLAQVTLAKTELVAPVDAYIQSRSIERGDEATQGTTVFVLVDAGQPEVSIAVPESAAASIRVGTGARVRLAGSWHDGSVARIEPAADTATRTVEARLRVPGLHASIGAVVNVQLGVHDDRGTAIPAAAIIEDPATSRSTVLVYDALSRSVIVRAVHVLASEGDMVAVEGVVPGESVVVAGQYEAKPGSPVRVVSKGGE